MKLYNRTITIALVLAALALILPATAQQPESTSKAGLTLKDLKKQNEEKKKGNGSSAGSSSSSNSGKSSGLNSLKKSNPSNGSGSGSYDSGDGYGSDGSSNQQDPYVKKYGVTREERYKILYGFFERFVLCRNHDGKFMPSSHDNQPFAVMYYPLKNFEYKALTGYDWTLGTKYDYTHAGGKKAKDIIEAIYQETGGNVKLRLAGAQELNFGRTFGAVQVAAPSDGIYFDVDLKTYDIINQFVESYNPNGGGMG